MTLELATVLLRMKRSRLKALISIVTVTGSVEEVLLEAEIKELKKIIKER